MTTVSVAMIVKNEEERLPKCIPTLVGFDEVVIHDTGSTDKTVPVATSLFKEYGLNGVVFFSPPEEPFHFANARNRVLDRCTGDWVVSVDADERFETANAAHVIRDIAEADLDRNVSGYKLWFRFDPGKVEYERFVIFRRDRWRWKNRVHNMLEPIGDIGVVSPLKQIVLEHFEPAHLRRPWREEQTFELLKIEVVENPEHIRAWRHLGLEYFLRGDWNEAIRCLKRYLSTMRESDFERIRVMLKISRAHEAMGRLEDALEWCRKAERIPFRDREPYWTHFVLLVKAKRHEEAKTQLEKVVAIPRSLRPMNQLVDENAWSNLPEQLLVCYKEGKEIRFS